MRSHATRMNVHLPVTVHVLTVINPACSAYAWLFVADMTIHGVPNRSTIMPKPSE